MSLSLSSAWASITVMGALDRHFLVEAGTTIEGELIIQNTADEPTAVLVEIRDYVQSAQQEAWPVPTAHPRSLAHHVAVAPIRQTLAPDGQAKVAFKIDLPNDTPNKPIAGAYWAVLMVSALPDQSADDLRLAHPGWVIRERFQTAVRLTATVIDNKASVDLRFVSPKLVWSSQPNDATEPRPSLVFDLENPGAHRMDMSLEGRLINSQGEVLMHAQLGRVLIYPGGARRLRWVLDHWVPDQYQALIIASPTETMPIKQRFGARYVLDETLAD